MVLIWALYVTECVERGTVTVARGVLYMSLHVFTLHYLTHQFGDVISMDQMKQQIIISTYHGITCGRKYASFCLDELLIITNEYASQFYPPVLLPCHLGGQTVIRWQHECDVIMGAMASQITILAIVYSTVYSGADQRNHQNSASLAFVPLWNLPLTGEFPAQLASNAENASIWWRHRVIIRWGWRGPAECVSSSVVDMTTT